MNTHAQMKEASLIQLQIKRCPFNNISWYFWSERTSILSDILPRRFITPVWKIKSESLWRLIWPFLRDELD